MYGVKTKSRASVEDDDKNSLGGVYTYTEGSNTNPNQYVIYVTQLDASEKYIIGDPRNQTPTKLSYLTKYGNGSLKGLQQYLKTKGEVTNEREVDNIIAPAFRIASSFGVTQDISYSIAQKRCASYQENGYPAGRWRVPTEAEIEFIVSLSNKKYIPELFDGEYFASSQRYYMGKSGSTGSWGGDQGSSRNGSHAVRCIYDVWYWGDDKIANPNVFTWGDTDPIRPAN